MLKKGDRVDRYTLVRRLGEGGQGSVWRAIDPLDGGTVRAIKLVEIGGWDASTVERVWREAQILEQAQHPALVRCHGLFKDARAGLVGLVFDLVRGQTLGEAASSMTMAHRCAALEQLAAALSHIHALGLIHRDLKLDNVMVTDTFWKAPQTPGSVKLVDFGIATAIGNPRPVTVEGGVIGTIPYLAPELIDPATWGRAPDGFARDLFAFGVLAWELLFDRHPTRLRPGSEAMDYARVYMAARSGSVPWPPVGLKSALGVAVCACLALRPEDRPDSGGALVEMLRTGVDAKAIARRVSAALSERTAPHSSPKGARTSTESMFVSTEPMPMSASPISARGAASTRTKPMAPSTAALTPPAEQVKMPPPAADGSKRGGGFGTAFAVLVVLASAGALVMEMLPQYQHTTTSLNPVTMTLSPVVTTPSPAVTTPDPFMTTPDPVVTPSPVVTTTTASASAPVFSPDDPPQPRSTPCCGGKLPCPSEHSCEPGVCDANLEPGERWWLRLRGAAARRDASQNWIDLASIYPTAEMRICIHGTERCAKETLAEIAHSKSGLRVLEIETSDLVTAGFDVQIAIGGFSIATYTRLRRMEGVQTSALCRGLLLYELPNKNESLFYLSVFIDPR